MYPKKSVIIRQMLLFHSLGDLKGQSQSKSEKQNCIHSPYVILVRLTHCCVLLPHVLCDLVFPLV